MKTTILALFAALSSASVASASGAAELTKGNFDELTKGKNSFVKFLAPWVGFCVRLCFSHAIPYVSHILHTLFSLIIITQ
jgi:putative Mn2+ efflux pump MntP